MRFKTLMPAVLFAVLALGAGIAHGIYSGRWTTSRAVDDAVKLMDNIPATVDDWQGTQLPIDERELARTGIKGHFLYEYRNARTGSAMNVFLVCGPAGRISVHPPDICYKAAGYESDGAPQLRLIDLGPGATQQFWSARYQKPNNPSAPPLEILWAWSAGDGWSAPDNPRFVFARRPSLYKLYLIRFVSPQEKNNSADEYMDFLKSLMPELNKALRPKAT
jgi:Protein of unknown function (DUF3485)